MKCEIILSSKTGNTKMLADEIQKKMNCEIHSIEEADGTAELLLLGFWVNQGTCNAEMVEFMKEIHHKKVILFGTMGTGDNENYNNLVKTNVEKLVNADNELLGTFICQGKMPLATRKRYESMLESDPRNIHMKMMLENFDHALEHPNQQDLTAFNEFLTNTLAKI